MLRAQVLTRLVPRQLSLLKSQPIPVHSPEEVHCESLLSILRRCTSARTVQQIHSQMVTSSIDKPNFLLAKLVDLKDMSYASLVFSRIPQPNDYAFNVMIRGLTTTRHDYSSTLHFYYRMKSVGLKPNNFTYPFLFIACANLFELDHGRAAHSSVFKTGLDSDSHTSHSLIMMYAKCRELENARKVFDEIADRDLVSWNSMISGYAKMGFAANAVELFGKMGEEGFMPDEMTVVSTLTACRDLGDLRLGKWIEGYVLDNGMKLNSYVGSALIDMYGKCGDLTSARRIFDKMVKRDVVTWNAMITGYAQNGMADEAITLFSTMREAGIDPDKITLLGVLSSCASIGALDLGKWVDTYVSHSGLRRDVYVGTALIDMYAKCGSLDNALEVFEDMSQKNEVSWNAMISALAFHGRAKESLALFDRMLKVGGDVCPNDITFVGVLSACVHGGLVTEGRRLFALMCTLFGLVPKIEHYSCMVDLFSRAGLLYEAWSFIEKMPGKPDEVVLGSLLGACQKRRNADIGERVMRLLLKIEPSNSGNYVISSKLYADVKKWDESARMRILMRQRGITKTPGCSWLGIETQLHEFHAGDNLHHSTVEMYQVLVEEMDREGYIPKADNSEETEDQYIGSLE
ncbi:pentatricopeptide repeat-containing protein At2g34400 isoform X3 [Rhodamnia argentea]|uniref:Pentatricopeptide repeat-containing protein At2g34400 isoform X3 n=1 Tax=Rhodamnia argentea TaxID=178133 RepID=A0A8B8QCT1_9MYRT|nr:pentatricopeptide repeat-containing protein At2g34400 isoform X3 [Rhodamnia argentea]